MLATPGHIISESFALYKRHMNTLLQYSGLIFIPAAINYFLINWTDSFAIVVLSVVVTSLISLWFSLSLIRTLMQLIESDKAAPIKKEITEAAKLILPAVLTSLLVSLAVFGGFLLFIIPGIIFSVWFTFSTYAVAVDGKRGVEALKTSKALVKGRWWSVFARLAVPAIVIGFIAWIIQLIASAPFSTLADNDPQSSMVIIGDVVNMIIALAIMPLGALAPAILYAELKKHPVEKTA